MITIIPSGPQLRYYCTAHLGAAPTGVVLAAEALASASGWVNELLAELVTDLVDPSRNFSISPDLVPTRQRANAPTVVALMIVGSKQGRALARVEEGLVGQSQLEAAGFNGDALCRALHCAEVKHARTALFRTGKMLDLPEP